MGISASSLLDDNKSNYIRGQAEAELRDFSPFYRKQFWVSRFSEVEEDLDQQKETKSQLLRQKEAPEAGEVLYEEALLYFDDSRKWRERYVVVRANYCLECHESLETFTKGVPARHKLLPTGGSAVTTEEKYMAMVDRCFPGDGSVKEEFEPPLAGMPGQFPVYLRLPYRRDSYFCFRQEVKQHAFISILSDCIRHQNQDFLKKKTCEVQAFVKAVQLYREDKDKYEAWNMLIGSDVRVLANLVMEQLLPSLEKEMLPRLKAKKTERKRVWFATVEAAYVLVQEHLFDGLSALKEECRTSARQQEVLIHSDMDQILGSRRELEERVREKVSVAAEKLSSEAVQPYLGSVLEELMEPVSSGFQDGRRLMQKMMDGCQDVLTTGDKEELKKALAEMSRPNLQSCYLKISSLQEKLQHLQDRFRFSNISSVIHSTQIDLQLLMENASFTFQQLLHKALQDDPDLGATAAAGLEKAKHRVLKQYDYDSSTVRKRIFQEALFSITLPFLKKNLAPSCRTELQALEKLIDADHSNFIHVENVYEGVLLQMLDKEVTKVVKEAASLKKYDLINDSRDLLSRSSRSSLSSPTVSTPGSPAMPPATPTSEPHTPSPLVANGLSSSPLKVEQQGAGASADGTVTETPLGEVQVAQSVFVSEEEEEKGAEPVQTAEAKADAAVKPETETHAAPQEKAQEVAAAAETVIQQEVFSVQTQEVEPASADVAAGRLKTDVEETAAPDSTLPTEAASEGGASPPAAAAAAAGDAQIETSADTEETPPGGEAAIVTPADLGDEAETPSASDPNSLDVSFGSESPPSDIESTEDGQASQSSEDRVSETSDVPEDHVHLSTPPDSPTHPNTPPENPAHPSTPPEIPAHPSTPPESAEPQQSQAQVADGSESIEVGAGAGAEVVADVDPEPVAEEAPPTPEALPALEAPPIPEAPPALEAPPTLEAPPAQEARAPDCIKDIRDLVVEVIEVEELLHRYPAGIPTEEE